MRRERRRGCGLARLALAALLGCVSTSALAWGAEGHRVIGALAEQLIEGTPAAAGVAGLLGGLRLQDAGLWADCARGVQSEAGHGKPLPGGQRAPQPGRHPECRPFDSPAEREALADFVHRNDSGCARPPSTEACHRQYHYIDLAIQREHYAAGLTGARPSDLLMALSASLQVLQGQVPDKASPVSLRDRREALLLLVHLVGDLHQPLHVASLYLDAEGRPLDPDAGGGARGTTHGGNLLLAPDAAATQPTPTLHQRWDELPPALRREQLDRAWLAEARAVPASPGRPEQWPLQWTDDTLAQARSVLGPLQPGPRLDGRWTVKLSAADLACMDTVKRRQLSLAAAHLAQLLQALWPPASISR